MLWFNPQTIEATFYYFQLEKWHKNRKYITTGYINSVFQQRYFKNTVCLGMKRAKKDSGLATD